ncbi:MAG TPA: hypothetical protein PKD64_06935 [Pirellulaceae bacterium]|nr:hypothetical protein [Pirellulaceae bacterium]HMO91918.1 hypothetical protein [Pirellulaceae bacterium]HMP68718.1 hypothetical protein [Pirellulaceae bacterium]
MNVNVTINELIERMEEYRERKRSIAIAQSSESLAHTQEVA